MAGKADIVEHVAGSVDGLTKKQAGEAFDLVVLAADAIGEVGFILRVAQVHGEQTKAPVDEVDVGVIEAGGHEPAGRIDLAPAAARLAADLREPACIDGHVARVAFLARPVDDGPAAYHQIVHH